MCDCAKLFVYSEKIINTHSDTSIKSRIYQYILFDRVRSKPIDEDISNYQCDKLSSKHLVNFYKN